MFELLNTIDAIVWGPAMIALLLGSHLFFTFKTGFIQRKLPQAIRLSFRKDPQGKGDISNFGALAAALDRGELAGAGLDVFAHEPIEEGNPLLSVRAPDRLLLSPPTAWAPVEALETMVGCIERNIVTFLAAQRQ